MGYIDYEHRKKYEDGYVSKAKEWGLTHHVILTVMPTSKAGRGIRTPGYAAKVANELAQESCRGPAIGSGDQVDGGQPHVHVLTTRSDARNLRDAWRTAGLGHVEVTSNTEDEADYRRIVLYVFEKFLAWKPGHEGMVYVSDREDG